MGSAEVAMPRPVPRKYENISTLQSRLWTAKEPALVERNLQSHLERYVTPPSQMGSTDSKPGFVLPVVDLEGLRTGDPSAREEIVRQIGEAAGKWGFFQVVNHGISEETVDTVDQQARHFFQLPVDVKERAEDLAELPYGYNGRSEHRITKAPWLEYFALWYYPKSKLEATAEELWPGGNPAFCNAVHGWVEGADKLGKQLLVLLAESVGLKPDTFSKEFQDPANYKSSWRLHRYPACPDPERILGVTAHSDTGIITILKQDAVGGLQVRYGEKYIDVAPVPGAIVVNIGDTLEVWSNGRFLSSEHRVLVNGQSDRYSLVYLIQGPSSPDFVVQCPPELVDDAHPSLYVPYTYAEYRANFIRLIKRGISGKATTLAFALRKESEGQHDNV